MSTEAKRSKCEDPAVSNFREYLRIKTVPPNYDYGAVNFRTMRASWHTALRHNLAHLGHKKLTFDCFECSFVNFFYSNMY